MCECLVKIHVRVHASSKSMMDWYWCILGIVKTQDLVSWVAEVNKEKDERKRKREREREREGERA